jgi:hypothetical protein
MKKHPLWIVLTLLLFAAMTPGQALANSFSGQATVVRANVNTLGLPQQQIVLVDTGPLPPEGGQQHASLVDASVPGLLSANVLHATTVAMGDASRSEASVAKLDVTVAGNTIGARFLMSRAEAFCGPNGPTVFGSSEIAELVINNQTIVVSTAPNQTVALPGGGAVIINEQSQSMQGNQADITVTALHIIVPPVAEIWIATAHADITCTGKLCPADKDFVTGGGQISTPSGTGTFAVAGGIKNGAYWGHLNFIDHGSGMKVKGTGVTRYDVTGLTTRHIEGTCEVTPQGDNVYKVDVDDQGEPGRNDVFTITLLPSGYTAGGKLTAGNIQLHICN